MVAKRAPSETLGVVVRGLVHRAWLVSCVWLVALAVASRVQAQDQPEHRLQDSGGWQPRQLLPSNQIQHAGTGVFGGGDPLGIDFRFARAMGVAPGMTRAMPGRFPQCNHADRCLPDFITIGAQKGGTTSFFHYLQSDYHPRLKTSSTSELNWFSERFHGGIAKLYEAFPPGTKWIRGYKSPNYFPNPFAPARMRFVLPNVKLVLILREPVSRAQSAWFMGKSRKKETRPFAKAMQEEMQDLAACLDEQPRLLLPPITCIWDRLYARSFSHMDSKADGWEGMIGPQGSYIAPGLYALQLEHWLRWFPLDQFYITTSKAFKAHTAEEMQRISKFVGLSDAELRQANVKSTQKEYFSRSMSQTLVKSSGLDNRTKDKLQAFLEPHNQALWKILGRQLDW